MFELDHLFVMVGEGGLEADSLTTFGLTEGEANTHPGQGTACRRFFFRNAYLELVWVHDAVEAQQEDVRPAGLWDRWTRRSAEASPFGLGLRPAGAGTVELPFAAWEYRPSYLPAPLAIHVGQNVPLSEPFWFFLAFGRRPDGPARPRPQPVEHAAGLREITGVHLAGPGLGTPSEAARAVAGAWAVALEDAAQHLAEVTFDGGSRGVVRDFRPALPIVLRC